MAINIGIGTAIQQKHTDGQAADVKRLEIIINIGSFQENNKWI